VSEHDVVTDPVASSALSGSSRKARLWRRWSLALLLVVVGLVGGALEYAAHYQPLLLVEEGGYGARVLTSDGAVGKYTGSGTQIGWWTEPKGLFTVEVAMTINSNGSLPITLHGVLAPIEYPAHSAATDFFDSSGKDEGNYGYRGGPRFHATSLAGHGSIELAVHWTQQCVPMSQDAGLQVVALPVQYSFLWFHHTVMVPMGPFTLNAIPNC
jgi:hypothetical protein